MAKVKKAVQEILYSSGWGFNPNGDEGDKKAEIGPVVKPVVIVLGVQQRI